MGIDKEISEWILEYLLRQATDHTLMAHALSILPIPRENPLLAKIVSLKTLDLLILDGSVSESILGILERIAKIYRDDDGLVLFESIKIAYCMVAVDCTVRFMEETGNGVGRYLDAVKRIWRDRIEYLEKSSNVDLVSDQLRRWKYDIEAAVYDDQVCKRIIAVNTRFETLKAVRSFLTEAWTLMGPTFLEQVAKKMGRSLLLAQNLSHCKNRNPVQEGSPCSPDRHNFEGKCVVEKATNTGWTEVPDTPVPVQQAAANSPMKSPVMKRNDQCENGSIHRQDRDGSLKPAMQIGKQPDQWNVRDHDLEENSETVPDIALKHKEVENSNALPKIKHVTGRTKRSCRGVQIRDVEESTEETSRNRVALLDSAEIRKVQKALQSSSLGLQAVVKDHLPEAQSLADAVISGNGRTRINAQPSAETQDRMDVNVPNHFNAQYVEAVQTKEKSMPGPSASHQNDDTRDGSHVDARAPNSFVNMNSKVLDGTRGNLGTTKRSYLQINATRAEFISRNDTAETLEWGDADELVTPGRPNSSKRLQLPRRKPITVSSLKKHSQPNVGGRRPPRRWSGEEEDTLRSGVEKFGEGNWKMILCAYREIFNERTAVDLKDKWRNMTR